MVEGVRPTPDSFWINRPAFETSLANLFIVSDTVAQGGIAELTRLALLLADNVTT
jgi:hypothetical protein